MTFIHAANMRSGIMHGLCAFVTLKLSLSRAGLDAESRLSAYSAKVDLHYSETNKLDNKG